MRPWIVLAGLSGLMAVGMGAYGAHGLAGEADAQALVAQAANYQIIHALALLGADRITVDTRRGGGMLAHGAALLFALGMALFCGSLYVKALTGTPLVVPMITPAGGMTLMAGWLVLALAGFRK